MRRLIPMLMVAAGCAKATSPTTVPAPGMASEVRPEWQPLIGEYASHQDTVSILEDGGTLHLYRWHESRSELRSRTDSTLDIAGNAGRVVVRRGPDRRTSAIVVGGMEFARLALGPEGGASFRIAPRRPVEELRREALAATPPAETGDFLPTDLVELVGLDSTIRLDIRYAGTNNFLGTPMYSSARAFLQRPAAAGVMQANQWLRAQGYGLLIHDGYRPWYVTKMFWEATPDAQRIFVADPSKGSRHNRGCAVDLTLFDLRTGQAVEMTGGYDEMSARSFPDYPGGTTQQRWLRGLLRRAMEAQGFTVYEAEWWHFDYQDWQKYRIGTQTFEEIGK
jgi:D-alanyl-D-alanine dipeptidase